MKRVPSFLVIVAATLFASAAHGQSASRATAVSPALRAQIDALLRARQWPEPLPIDPPNPFVVIHDSTRGGLLAGPGRTAQVKTGEDPRPAPAAPAAASEISPATAAEVLGNTAGRLKLGGVMQLKDKLQIVVNDLPRREGDTITVVWNGATYPLRVVKVQPGLLIIGYEGAEMMLRF